jgi:nicotinate-nucleotide adenylyltransferase
MRPGKSVGSGPTATDPVAAEPGGSRTAVFGGTFDPPHVGHLAVAQDVHETLGLDTVLFIPAARPPHKEGVEITDPELRFRMVEAAVGDDPRFRVSRLELEREGPSWTVETLRRLRERDPGGTLFLLLGADQWAGFGSWREPEAILELATPVLMSRNGDHPQEVDPGLPSGLRPEFREVRVTRMDLSSTELRHRVREGRPIRYLVPEPVRRIIEDEKLYL